MDPSDLNDDYPDEKLVEPGWSKAVKYGLLMAVLYPIYLGATLWQLGTRRK